MLMAFFQALAEQPDDLERAERYMRGLEEWVDKYSQDELLKYVGKTAKVTVKPG